jgi:hypothetical protein
MMPPYSIRCTQPGCDREAEYKIAARWSDGLTGELKTYALSCLPCISEAFRQSRLKQAASRLAPNETLEPPGIFALHRGKRDRELIRRADLEQSCLRK